MGWYAETLARGGWWVTTHESEAEAKDETEVRESASAPTASPVLEKRVRKKSDPPKPATTPSPPRSITFDDYWPPPT